MKDQELRRELRRLPRARARAGFTRDLLDRLPEKEPRPFSPGKTTWILAVAALLSGLAVGLWVIRSTPSHEQAQAEVEAATPANTAAAGVSPQVVELARRAAGEGDPRLLQLLDERSQLLQDIQRLRQQRAEASPVLYLGGDESVDVVVDLGEVARRRPAGHVRPASYSP